jgi:hypothetical protein
VPFCIWRLLFHLTEMDIFADFEQTLRIFINVVLSWISSFQCSCVVGFTGKDCQININDCQHQPCQHSGVCVDGVNSFACLCKAGYSGTLCEVNIDDCKGKIKDMFVWWRFACKQGRSLLQVCKQVVTNLFTSCRQDDKLCSHSLFPVVVTSLEPAVNKLDSIVRLVAKLF